MRVKRKLASLPKFFPELHRSAGAKSGCGAKVFCWKLSLDVANVEHLLMNMRNNNRSMH
jgi:hypothetical protein